MRVEFPTAPLEQSMHPGGALQSPALRTASLLTNVNHAPHMLWACSDTVPSSQHLNFFLAQQTLSLGPQAGGVSLKNRTRALLRPPVPSRPLYLTCLLAIRTSSQHPCSVNNYEQRQRQNAALPCEASTLCSSWPMSDRPRVDLKSQGGVVFTSKSVQC